MFRDVPECSVFRILLTPINSSQKDKALPVKTSTPNFVTFFGYFANSLYDYFWNFFVCYGSKPETHFVDFARDLREFGVARPEELEVNQWMAVDIHWLSSQSKRAKSTIHCFRIYSILLQPKGWIAFLPLILLLLNKTILR